MALLLCTIQYANFQKHLSNDKEERHPIIAEIEEQELFPDGDQPIQRPRKKKVDIQSEQELANHSMSEKDSDILEADEESPDIPEDRNSNEASKEANNDQNSKVKVLKHEDTPAGTHQSSKRASFVSSLAEFNDRSSSDLQDKQNGISKVSSKSVHLIIEDETTGSQIVEPEKDKSVDDNMPRPPRIDSVPVVGTNDSLDLQKVDSLETPSFEESDEKKSDGQLKEYSKTELDKLKEENKMLREGGEIKRLKEEIEEKMKRILELNEENRNLNDMINILRQNQAVSQQKEPLSEAEPISSDSDYITEPRQPPRFPNKPSSSRRRFPCRPDNGSRKKCGCQECAEKSKESLPFIDVYKREDKGKFISDSSSTVCYEDICSCLKYYSPFDSQHRVRGGNDTNQPTTTLPNFQYAEVVDKCEDETCPTQVSVTVETDEDAEGGNSVKRLCKNKSCMIEGCEAFEGDFDPSRIRCNVDKCLNTVCMGEEPLNDFMDQCTDRTCPNKDPYEPTEGYNEDPSETKIIYIIPNRSTELPPGSEISNEPPQRPERSTEPPSGSERSNELPQRPKRSTELPLGGRVEDQEGVKKTPSECICGKPEECQMLSRERPTSPPSGDVEQCRICGCILPKAGVNRKKRSDVPEPEKGTIEDQESSDKLEEPKEKETRSPQPDQVDDKESDADNEKQPQAIESSPEKPVQSPEEVATPSQQKPEDEGVEALPENEKPVRSPEEFETPSQQKPEDEGAEALPETEKPVQSPEEFETPSQQKPEDEGSYALPENEEPVQSPEEVETPSPQKPVESGTEGPPENEEPVQSPVEVQTPTPQKPEELGAKGSPENEKPVEEPLKKVESPRLHSPNEDTGRTIIRCICRSKYCKVIPDPDNPTQKLCVDVSDACLNPKDEACVCTPICPHEEEGHFKDDFSYFPKPNKVVTVNQLYQMPKTPESLSKEQEYAGLSRKDSFTRGYIAPKRASSRYGLQDEELSGDPMKNADLKLVIADLKSKLLDAEDRIEELKVARSYNDKDNDTALITRGSKEMNEMKKSIKWSKKEREEYEYLKQKVKLLEQGKGDTANINSNLQTAVDLYVDTIELLESSEQKLKSEIEHYKVVNETLHENILNMREEMESFKYSVQKEIDEQKWNNFILQIENVDAQQTNQMYSKQVEKYQTLYEQLMELNYNLEIEHISNLQDLSMIESQFNKYQTVCKMQEEEKIVVKNQLKKLTKKNKCYEEVVQFFKEEMSVMSDELLTLQEVLNVSNVSSLEENNKLIGAILQLRRINDRLVNHLCAIEKQAVLENQINQINEARINELQSIISEKNNDLTQHDEIIQEMRRKLNNATRQNSDLKKTIKNLTDTVVEIQEGIKSVERDQIKNLNDISHVESKVCLANGDLEAVKTCMEQKNKRILELENQLKDQGVNYVLATKELGMLKEKKAEKKELINSLKEQLSITEKKNEQILLDYQMIVKKLQDYSSLDHMKNFELNHYKSLVDEMKMSLEQLNNGLERCEASNVHFYEDFPYQRNNLPITFEELKKSMANLKKKISEADFKGGIIEEELLKVKESHMFQIPEELEETQHELEVKITAHIEEQNRLNQLVEQQKQEIEKLRGELELEKKNSCDYKKSVSELKNEKTSSNSEMEISQLKCELNKSIYRQKVLNEENDQIHTQMINLRKKLTILEERYEILSQEKEEYKVELKRTSREKEYLAHKNHDMAKTIEQMRSTHDQLEKQCRYYTDRVHDLELELSEAQTEKDNVYAEAQNVARVVKMWFQEQSIVNEKIRQKFEGYNKTIANLRTMMKKMSDERSWIKMPMQQPFSSRRYGTAGFPERRLVSPERPRKLDRHTTDIEYRSVSPWGAMNTDVSQEYPVVDVNSHKSNMMRNISYDSNSSPYTSRSPSPGSNSGFGLEDELEFLNSCDWVSPDYKETETDAEDGEEIFINKIQLMTAQVQEANKRWQRKMRKDHSSKCPSSNK